MEVTLLLGPSPFLIPWSRLDDLVLRWLQNTSVHLAEVVAEVAWREEGVTAVRVLVYFFRVGLSARIFGNRSRRHLLVILLGLRQLLGEDEVLEGVTAELLENVFLV